VKEKIIASRYAEAFVSYARETIGIAKAIAGFKRLKAVIRDIPEVQDFFNSPGIRPEQKCEFIDNVFKGAFPEELINFLKLLIHSRRVELFFEIADYIRINYARNGALDALLKSAYPLDSEAIRLIKVKLEQRFKRKLNLFLELDAGLLGGAQVTVGNQVIDGSIKKRLSGLGEKLKEVRV
jgi:F-type H+-transporting ATPase subunit delta